MSVSAHRRQPRRPFDQAFRRTDVARLIKAAKQQGLSKYRIDIKRDGGQPALSLIVDETAPAPTEQTNDLDNWMAKHPS